MQNYEVHTYIGFRTVLRHKTDSLAKARSLARRLREDPTADYDGTAIYDNIHCEWIDRDEIIY